MHHPRARVVEVDDQVLAAPPQPGDRPPDELLAEFVARHELHEPRRVRRHKARRDRASDHARFEVAAYSLDFRQFGHAIEDIRTAAQLCAYNASMRLPAADRWLLLALVATLAAAVALTIVVGLAETPLPGEERIIREVQSWAFPGQTLSDFIRAITTTGIVIILGTLLAAGLFIIGERRDALVLLVLLFALAWLQPAIKDIVDRPRPDVRACSTSAASSRVRASPPATS